MARTPVEGSGHGPAQGSSDQPIVLSTNAGSIALPDGISPADLEMSREGQNLVLTTPDGQTLIVENYFLMPDAPLIIGANGALLTPDLVQSFLTNLNDIEVAAGPQVAADVSAVGEVIEVSGEATVTHADGSKEKITSGTQIFEGDIVETDAKGAVNIQFADESTFAVSQNARLAVDDFSFNTADQSGSTGLSILRGVFMFTSGLVGRENPDAVHLNTPVGSIGIRGTIIGGEISADGKAQISVIEGAIVVRNGAGEQILSQQFETVQLSGFNAPMTNVGTLNAGQMTQSYGAVRSVSPALFTSIDDTARDQGNQQQQGQPQGEAQPQNNDAKTQGEAQPQQGQPQGQPSDAAHAQGQAEAQPQTQPAAPAPLPAMSDAPVFQTLATGSNLQGGLGSATQTTPPPAPSVAAPATPPAPPAPAPAPAAANNTQTTSPENLPPPRDTRPPSTSEFSNNTNTTAVNEDSAAGTVVGVLHQTQSLPFAVTYSLAANPGGIFAINPTTGVITVADDHKSGDVDVNPSNAHDIVVRATRVDNAAIFTETPLHISLTAVNEAPSLYATHSAIPTIAEGYGNKTVALTPSMVGGSDPENDSVTYNVSDLVNGKIQINNVDAPGFFTQADLDAGLVKFVHNGNEPSAGTGFKLTPTDGTHAGETKFFHVTVSPENDAPVVTVIGGGSIAENSTTLLKPDMFTATDTDNGDEQIVYNVSVLNHIALQKYDGTHWVNTWSFTQYDLAHDRVQIVQEGDENSFANMEFTVTDGLLTTGNQTLTFTVTPVNDAPRVNHNASANFNEGLAVQLTDSSLQILDDDNTNLSQLTYTISAETNGHTARSTDNGLHFTNVTTFTQQEVHDGLIYFVHDDTETTTASFKFTAEDPSHASTGTPVIHSFTINPVNDEPVSVTLIPTVASLAERSGTGATAVTLANLTIDDAEGAYNPTAHSFDVQYKNSSNVWVTDNTRFAVVDTGSGWELQLKANVALDYETMSQLKLQVILKDGPHTLTSANDVTVTINDVDEMAMNFVLNEGMQFNGPGQQLLLSGYTQNPYIAVINSDDPDTALMNRMDATNYRVKAVTDGYVTSDFTVINVTDDNGHVEQVLKYNGTKNGVAFKDFDGTAAFTITVQMDGNRDGDFNDAEDKVNSAYSIIGRNDIMQLEAVNGKNGVLIENDSRFPVDAGHPVHFGAAVAAGNGLLVFGAPGAQNDSHFVTGGIYTIATSGNFQTDILNGDVMLSRLTNFSSTPSGSLPLGGFYYEPPTGNQFASHVAVLGNFNGEDPSVAIVTPNIGSNAGAVSVFGAGGAHMLSINNIPNGGVAENLLAKAINIASLGDINGDGLTDLLIGVTADSSTGKSLIVFGNNNHTTTDYTSIVDGLTVDSNDGKPLYLKLTTENVAAANFGSGVAGLGDINNDGYADYAISSPNANNGDGKHYIYFGNNSESEGSPLVINGSTKLTSQITAAGDFNGDGLNDFMIRSDAGMGSVQIVFGNRNLDVDTTFFTANLSGSSGTTNFNGLTFQWSATNNPDIKVGDVIGSAGDFNADGFDDVAVDVVRHYQVTENSTLVDRYEHTLMVIYGYETNGVPGPINLDTIYAGSSKPEADKAYKIRLQEPMTSNSEHLSVTAAGDINGDGFDDLLIGNPSGDDHQDGEAYIVYGHNYNEVAHRNVTQAPDANGQYYLGDDNNNNLGNGIYGGLSFSAGKGDDSFTINKIDAFRNFDGGQGRDTLKLFFSADENDSDSPGTNFDGIDFSPSGSNPMLSGRMTGVEVIAFDDNSYSDKLVLNVHDVLSLLASSDDGTLTITTFEAEKDGTLPNEFLIKDGGSNVDLTAWGFTKDLDNNSTTDTRSIATGGTGYVYTHEATGFELIVDTRLTNAGALSTG